MVDDLSLHFEILSSDDGLLAKRARVTGGYIYLFQEWDGHAKAATSCFVPDEPEPNEYGERGAEQIYGAIRRGMNHRG